MDSITEEERLIFQSAFSEFDKNGDGSISTKVRVIENKIPAP